MTAHHVKWSSSRSPPHWRRCEPPASIGGTSCTDGLEQSANLFGDVATAPAHQCEKSLQWKQVAHISSSGEESERMTKHMWHGSVIQVIPQTTSEESNVIEPPPLAQ